MKILGLETSCDETAAAVITDGRIILSNIIASSANLHAKTGGIIPEQAARKQIESIIPVINQALSEAHCSKDDIYAIAVTTGPGLIGSLLVGVETAKTLAYVWQKPLIPVNHLLAHIYANWLGKEKGQEPKFPALALVVSGGHTDLILMQGHTDITWIGGTRDDAAGEAFDKTARLLDLPYPGGPNLSKLADAYIQKNREAIENNTMKLQIFPRPLSSEDTFDWSFSGLKTSVFREIQHNNKSNFRTKEAMAAQIQEAIVDSIIGKLFKAIDRFEPQSVLLGGGVAANSRLREKIVSKAHSRASLISFHVAEPRLCTDNAAIVGSIAYYHNKQIPFSEVSVNPNLKIIDMLD